MNIMENQKDEIEEIFQDMKEILNKEKLSPEEMKKLSTYRDILNDHYKKNKPLYDKM